MLRSLKWFVLGLLVMAAAGGWLTYTRYVVKTEDGYRIVPKRQPSFQTVYVDTTKWGPLDWLANTEISDAILQDKLERAKRGLDRQTQEMKDAWDKGLEGARKELEKRGK